MENGILKKRLSTFRTEGGKLTKVSDEVLIEMLKGWESWTGSSKDFYKDLGLSKTQLAVLIKKAKRLCRDGSYSTGDFKEVKIESPPSFGNGLGSCCIEISWDQGKVIRFAEVSQLVNFLKLVS